METRKFKNGEKEIDVKVDYENGQVWLSQKDMSDLYGKNTDTISYHIKNIKNGAVTEDYSDTEASFPVTGDDGKTYNVKHYNLDIILQVGYKCNVPMASLFKEWSDTLFKEDDTQNDSNNWLSGANNYEIVKFESGEVSLDVNVSPNEDTVWLTQNDMAILFDVTISNISQHISNIYESKELEMIPTIKNFLTVQNEGDRKISRNVNYYNLDMVISVGYRVNSKRGIEFRSWANNILKQYLIKGYAINTKRCMEHSDILTGLSSKLVELSESINDIKKDNEIITEQYNQVMTYFNDTSLHKHYILLKGEQFEADIAYQNVYSLAKHSIYIIDDYVDIKTLELLKSAISGIEIIIITDNKGHNNLSSLLIDDFKNETNYKLSIKKNKNTFHSRYIVIDYNYKNYKLYLCGGSSKDGGNKINTITEIEEKELYKDSINKALSNEELKF